jgi:23S rRNA pseudouridine1911/1915/1917 synthase
MSIESDILEHDAGEPEEDLLVSIPPEADGRLDAWLATQLPDLSRARIQALIKEGHITCDDKPVKTNSKPKAGSTLCIRIPAPAPAIPQPENIPLTIVYEDADILVINKQAGLVVHPAPGHLTGTLVNALLYHCKDLAGIGGVERPGLVHRLDRETSGLMLVAKNDVAMAGLVKGFQDGAVHKTYLTLVHGTPLQEKGTLRGLIGRHPVDRKKMAIVTRNGKHAITHWFLVKRFKGVSFIRCEIETGRTHQIRVHLQSLGHPVIGDSTYGRSSADKLLPLVPQRQMLHATELRFCHPRTGVEMTFKAELPQDFQAVLDALG